MFRQMIFLCALATVPGMVFAQSPGAAVATSGAAEPAAASTTAAPPASAPIPLTMAGEAVSSRPADAVTGVWITSGGKSHVKIYRGGDGRYYGKIVWLKEPRYPANYDDPALAGKPKVDINNPDASLRDRPVLGMLVLTDFKYYAPDDDWRHGKCYDPQKGETYDCKMWLEPKSNGDVLKVRGFVWIFHRTETWHRYEPAASGNRSASMPQ